MASILLKGDQDGDGKISLDEFSAIGEKWFSLSDPEKTGSVSREHLERGLDAVLSAAGMLDPFHGPPGLGGGRVAGGVPGRPADDEGHRPPGFGFDYPTAHADLNFNGAEFKDIGIRYKGNFTYMASRGQLKRSLKIVLNEFSKGQKLTGLSTLNLHSEVTDPAWMNEALSYRLFRDAGVPSPRTAYARVFLTVPGKYDRKYVGLYALVENIDKYFARDRFGSKNGAIFKPETRDLFSFRGDDWTRYEKDYGGKGELSSEDQQPVIDFARIVTHASDAEFSNKLAAYLDLQEFARFMAVTTWLSNLDSLLSMGHNFYVYLDPKTQKFQFIPWDLDLSFGKFNMGGGSTEKLSIRKPWSGQNRFLERVFAVDEFKQAYLARMKELSETLCKPERLARQLDDLANVIRPAVAEESPEKLVRFDRSVRGETGDAMPVSLRSGPGSPSPAPSERAPQMGPPGGPLTDKPIRTFVAARAKSVDSQLAGEVEENESKPRRGPGGFGPGGFLADSMMRAFDSDGDGVLSHEEFTRGFDRWFERSDSDHTGLLTEEQIEAGIATDLRPGPGGPPGAGLPPPP